jgi:flavin reductase (DIM6/NTAB) family NADH-FMN oxidoreductase RutF
MTLTTEPVTRPADDSLDPTVFRGLLRRQASTVTVVTAPGLPPAGFTVTSFTSVSLHPPVVSFCLGRGTSSWLTVSRAGHVAVHLLAAGQQELAARFATSGVDRFGGPTRWHLGPHGVPLLDGTLAWLLCRVVDRVEVGDHTVVLATPLQARHGDGEPLLYHNGRYAGLRPPPPAGSHR